MTWVKRNAASYINLEMVDGIGVVGPFGTPQYWLVSLSGQNLAQQFSSATAAMEFIEEMLGSASIFDPASI